MFLVVFVYSHICNVNCYEIYEDTIMSIEAIGKSASISSGAPSTSSYTPNTVAASAPDAVATELPQPQAVIAAAKSASLPADDTQQAQVRAAVVEKIKPNFIKTQVVSSADDDIVFLSVDERTGEVLNKFPNNAVLASNAYNQIASTTKADNTNIERVA